MQYININDRTEIVSYKQAVVQGLGKNKGLFVPEQMPKLPQEFFDTIEDKTRLEVAFAAMRPFIPTDIISDERLTEILDETFSFDIPVVNIAEGTNILELFHGPTLAFKDVGARFMARCLGEFTSKEEVVTVLVATSGDTGSAVAQGFYNVEGVRVVILFPKGKVSPFQEYQMTSLGNNIEAVEVDGTFDDCQALVKQALHDESLQAQLNLSTANSINVARFIPQMLYYFFAYQQMKSKLGDKELVVCVPSGNFGNITAGLYGQAMGLPIKTFIAANNANDTFYNYLQDGKYIAKPSVQTFANAMDVGDPSNFVRIKELFGNDHSKIAESIKGFVVDNNTILEEIKRVKDETGYVICPHGAVGTYALKQYLKEGQKGLVLATASPDKFDSVIQKVISDFPSPNVDLSNCKKEVIGKDFEAYKVILLKK